MAEPASNGGVNPDGAQVAALMMEHVAKAYGGPGSRAVFRDLSLTLKKGEYVAIMGESGVGKSTLLNLIAGLDSPDGGRIAVAGRDLTRLDDDARSLVRRRGIGFVFQAFHLLPHLTVAENIALPLALNGWKAAQRDGRVRELAQALGLAERLRAFPRELSGGEQQRVAVARAVAHRPALVLADEPTGNLDEASAGQVLGLLRRAVEEAGGSGILVTHSRRAAASAQRILVLDGEGLHVQ